MTVMKMHFILLFFYIILTVTSGKKVSCSGCGYKEKFATLLDTVIDSVTKIKENIPTCPVSLFRPLDCEELLNHGYNTSGVYKVWPNSRLTDNKPLEVFCDMVTDGGGWTVIQRRGNFLRPTDYFYQDWQSYKIGFGNIEEDFWLGNDNIYSLTNQKLYSVRIDLQDVEGNKRYAFYDKFWIEDENRKYTLHIDNYCGDAGDSMINTHNNQKFSTKDQDNDNEKNQHCAQVYKGGWWYNACHSANLNGLYLRGKHKSYADGVNWSAWKGQYESMDKVEIKIRQKNFHRSRVDVDYITCC